MHALSTLHHPNIVQYYQSWIENGTYVVIVINDEGKKKKKVKNVDFYLYIQMKHYDSI